MYKLRFAFADVEKPDFELRTTCSPALRTTLITAAAEHDRLYPNRVGCVVYLNLQESADAFFARDDVSDSLKNTVLLNISRLHKPYIGSHSALLPIAEEEGPKRLFSFLHVREDYPGDPHWRRFKDKKYFTEFAANHELGHDVSTLLYPRENPLDTLMDEGGNVLNEQFSDVYAGILLLRRHGTAALPFLDQLADIRLVQAIHDKKIGHFTTYALDSFLADYRKNPALIDQDARDIADYESRRPIHDFNMVKFASNAFNDIVNLKEHDPSSQMVARLALAIERSFQRSSRQRRQFAHKHDLLDMNIEDPRVIDLLMTFGWPGNNDDGLSARTNAHFKGNLQSNDNRYPDFQNWITVEVAKMPYRPSGKEVPDDLIYNLADKFRKRQAVNAATTLLAHIPN
ncbi:MAG TPA: hypothetical protein VIN59_08020 [Alphaproteobacteria bacterium]